MEACDILPMGKRKYADIMMAKYLQCAELVARVVRRHLVDMTLAATQHDRVLAKAGALPNIRLPGTVANARRAVMAQPEFRTMAGGAWRHEIEDVAVPARWEPNVKFSRALTDFG